MNKKVFLISVALSSYCIAAQVDDSEKALTVIGQLQQEKCREEKSALTRSNSKLQSMEADASTTKTVSKESTLYMHYKLRGESWNPINWIKHRILKPTQQEYDEIRNAAYAHKDRGVINYLESNGPRIAMQHHPLAEIIKIPLTFVWNHKKAAVCGAAMAIFVGSIAYQNGRQVGECDPICKTAYDMGVTNTISKCSRTKQPHTHVLHQHQHPGSCIFREEIRLPK